MKYAISTLIFLTLITSANALVYYQQDWTNNGDSALILSDIDAPFNPDCIAGLGNKYHNIHLNSTIVSPNFILSCKHWKVSLGCRVKSIGNTSLYLGKDQDGKAQYSDIYIVSDIRDVSGADYALYRVKKAIDSTNPNVPDPNEDSGYDWTNDPDGYFEDANFTTYMPLFKETDELDKDAVIGGFGPQRIFGVHDLFSNSPYEYAIGSGTLHWGYNQIYSTSSSGISVSYYTEAINGEVENEVGVGVLDSGTGIYIYDENDSKYKISGTFSGGVTHGGGFSSFGGPRVSSFIDDIALNVASMGTPTFADKLLGGLKPDITIANQIENSNSDLNPIDPNSDNLTITVTTNNLSEFINNGAVMLTLYLDVPSGFDENFSDPNSDFVYDYWEDRYYCNVILSGLNPNDPVSTTLNLRINKSAEPMTSVEIFLTSFIDDIVEGSGDVSNDIANWSDPDSESGVIYVNAAAGTSTSGTSWGYPYRTLQDAFARAIKQNSGIDKIWLAAGTYTADQGQSFSIDNDIEIYGGFVGGETSISQRSNVADKTILTVSDPMQNVFWMSTEGTQRSYVLDGLTITGSAQNGIYLRRNILDIRHCVITGNGSGIAGNNATLSMHDSIVSFNETGLDLSYSGVAADMSVITLNEGTGIKLNSCGLFMLNSVLSENLSYGLDIMLPITNEILNCNIVNNSDDGLNGITGVATTKINNCIVFGNSDDTIPTGQYIGSNVQSDPNFWHPYIQGSETVNYQLSSQSTNCIDNGSTPLVFYYPLDLYGQDRVIDDVEIGAVEFLPIPDADFNADGIVNLQDYSSLASGWAASTGEPNYVAAYDLDSDGTIEIDDLHTLADKWLYGALDTGYITSTYKVDFGYRTPEMQPLMMTLPNPSVAYAPEYGYFLDGTLMDINVFSTEQQSASTEEMFSIPSMAIHDSEFPIESRLNSAKKTLDNQTEAIEESSLGFKVITPIVNSIKVKQQLPLQTQFLQASNTVDFLNKIYKDEIKGNIDRKTWKEFMDNLEDWVDSLAEDYLNSTE